MATTVTVEISACQGAANKIDVRFPYNPSAVEAIRTIAGRKYIPGSDKHWHVPLDMETCRQLREAFGKQLVIGPNLFSWAKEASRKEASLGSISIADTAELTRLPDVLPKLHQAIHVGPIGLSLSPKQLEAAMKKPGSYQAADVRFLVDSDAPLNGNEQGTGKTPEWIAAVWEGSLERGVHLVVAPTAAVDGTWEPELEKWHEDATCSVGIYACTGNRAQREAVLDEFRTSNAPVKWVVVNPEMVRFSKDETRTSNVIRVVKGKAAYTACRCNKREKPHEHYVAPYPILFDTKWTTVAVDEAHKNSVRNHRSITSWSMDHLKYSAKRVVMTGTPMRKKGSDLWGILNWLRPDVFTSYWNFAESYFHIDDNGYGKKVLGLRTERRDAFFRMLQPYMLRRLKSEVLPWLPPKHHVPVWCTMGDRQAKQYAEMKHQAMTVLEDDAIYANGVLAEFTRLKQFATSYCTLNEDGDVMPTETSCKLDAMLAKMEEQAMFDEDSTRKQVVFSQSRRLINLVVKVLQEKGLEVDTITGGQYRKGQRRRIVEQFQQGTTRVLCVVTTAGGVSLTLDAADEAHFLDESWAPDDDQQAEDRIHRASRVHQVTIFHYRTHDTIDDYVMDIAASKDAAHKFIMDVRRDLLKKAHV